MATTVTPPAGSGTGAAPSSASAAPATATPASSSAAGAGQGSGQGSSSAAASQQGAGSPATPDAAAAAAAAVKQEPLSTEQIIKKTLEDKLKFDDKGDITNAEEAVKHPLEETEVKKVDAAAKTETKTEEKTEEQKAADAAAEPAENPYESNEGIAAKDLSARINENPALKAELEKSPELRNQLYANARLAARVGEYEKVFMSPHEAQVAAEAHGSFSMLSGLLNQVSYDKPETANQFLRAMVEQTYLRDEEGQILKNEKGEPRSSGAVGRFVKTMFGQRLANDLHGLNQQLEQAKAKGDDDAVDSIQNDLAAMERAAERLGLRTPSGAEEGDLPEHVRREKQQLAEERKRLDEEKTTQRQQQQERFEEDLAVGTQEIFDKEIADFLKNATGLDEHNRAIAMRNIKLALQDHLNKNGYYGDEYDRAARQGNGAKTRQKLLAINLKYMRSALQHHVADKALSDAGAHLAWQQQKVEETQAAREAAARGDTRTALGTPRPAGAMNTAQVRQQIVADYQQSHGGESPTQEQILKEQLVRGFAAAAQR
jgi:hypothetical protein